MGKRYDKRHRALKKGESERSDGYYQFRWTSRDGKRHTITSPTLEELRQREEEVLKDQFDGIRAEAQNTTLNDIFEMWRRLKRRLKDNTFQNYCYMYNQFVKPDIGTYRISNLKRSDIKNFYNMLVDERNLKFNTIDSIHTVLHQVIQLAVEDNYIRTNIADNQLKELKQSRNMDSDHRKALTVPEQELFLGFLSPEDSGYHHWYPIFAVMCGTGMRVGEITGLRWEDISIEDGVIDVNHTLVYYDHGGKDGCYFNIHTPKTSAGRRKIPMLDYVKEAFIMERDFQNLVGRECKVTIDGYTDFIFINRFGSVQHQSTLNKALRRIIRDCNDKQLLERKQPLLPRFSCHSLRHTFTTRLCEAGVNLKVVQDVLGHKDFSTTMDIYTDVTEELRRQEFDNLQQRMNEQKKKNMAEQFGAYGTDGNDENSVDTEHNSDDADTSDNE